MYDGNVGVADIRNRQRKFVYQSTVTKHYDPIWEIIWTPGEEAIISFNSVSIDGQVLNWKLKKSKLDCEQISRLKLVSNSAYPSATALKGLANGLCFDFSKFDSDTFLVGTEEGKILKCSKYSTDQYVSVYEGHSMAVYAVKWNRFHREIFLSASADWSVKIWNQNSQTALCSFDLNQGAVGDIDWSFDCSTVFSAVNAEGTVFMFDIEKNRLKEVCSQKIVKKGKLTRVVFNKNQPVVIVGDDKGVVYCMKLCGDLNKSYGDKEKERERMEKVINILTDSR